jgi:hypothetical protein
MEACVTSTPSLVYLLYGPNPAYRMEMTYSLMSAFARLAPGEALPQTILYCDAQNALPDLPVAHRIISDEDRRVWSLDGRYPHAIKAFVLRDALSQVQDRVMFVDTDTEFRASPWVLLNRITGDQALMHAIDGRLSDAPAWAGLIRNAAGTGLVDTVYPAATMYNSGLIGVHPGMADQVDLAIALMDHLFALDPVFNIEQFALGAIFARGRSLALGADAVEHYWGWKRHVYHARIPDALTLVDGRFTPEGVRQLLPVRLPAKPLRAQLRARLLAVLHGMNPDQRFATLAYQCSRMTRIPGECAMWENIARDMIRLDPDRTGFTARHLGGLALPQGEKHRL